MLKFSLFLLFMLNFAAATASEHVKMYSLGTSTLGQYIALEESGYRATGHTYYVTVRFIDLWTDQDVGQAISLEVPARKYETLSLVRKQAKELAQFQMKKLKINPL